MRKIFKRIAIIATTLLTVGSVNAQVTIGVSEMPSKYSILDLKEDAQGTSTKGFHLPRMTEAARDTLILTQADSTAARGLLIYNLDENCKNFWNGKEWISLCQGSSNPEVNIPVSECNRIRVYGQYYKSAPLNNAHYITVPVTVTQKGNYSIIAKSNNGYYFQTSGIFDNVGTFELRIEGMGTPAQNGTDVLNISCNGAIIGSLCDVKITVGAQTMGYQTEHQDSIKVEGSYQTRKFMTSNDNYVTVPIDVLVEGQAAFETNMVNGIKFVCSQALDSVGANTLILTAQGSPKQAGKFTFTFTTNGSIKTTCSFEVTFISTLGEFSDPACKCLDIYEENPMADDGEYWLQDCQASSPEAVKTFCDIKNGGWTLVWSYSEQTARNLYTPTNSMIVNGGSSDGVGHSANYNTPHNRVTAENGTINYNNYRLNRDEWRHFPNSTSRPQLKARVTVDPKDMNDEWALNNYVIIMPQNTAQNPIEWPSSSGSWQGRVPTEGKIYGKRFKVDPSIRTNSNYGGWDEMTGNRDEIVLYSGSSFCTHYNFDHRGGNSTQFQVIPNPGNLSGDDNSIAMNQIDNVFGWFDQAYQSNHHFGKCPDSTSDYSFSVKQCAGSSRIPHSTINSGQGRIMQWFVR